MVGRHAIHKAAFVLLRQHNQKTVGRESLRTFSVTPQKGVDPRVRRTRQLLQQALLELFQEKSLLAITVQDIAERASVNRATFYAHFEDKYDLLDSIIREEFQKAIASKLPPMPAWNIGNLRLLIRAVFDFLGEFHRHCPPSDTQFGPMFERAVQQELYTLLLTWLKQAPATGQRAALETLASVMSWAVFGTAARWSRETHMPSAEEMTTQVVLALSEGLARLIPGFAVERRTSEGAARA
jgi:AcrR family transcriptional regulator